MCLLLSFALAIYGDETSLIPSFHKEDFVVKMGGNVITRESFSTCLLAAQILDLASWKAKEEEEEGIILRSIVPSPPCSHLLKRLSKYEPFT